MKEKMTNEDVLKMLETVKMTGNEWGSNEFYLAWDVCSLVTQRALLDKGLLNEEDLERALDEIRSELTNILRQMD